MRAVFLDRDGTSIIDPPDERVDSWEEIKLFPDSLAALQLLATLDYGVFLITNQAGISEGLLDYTGFTLYNHKVIEEFETSGIKILRTYMCPHGPNDGCDCRKPKPTMLLQAAQDFDIDLSQSWMIGDHASDIGAGINAGTKTILVQTANKPEDSDVATYVAPTLLDAIKYIQKQN